MSQLPSPPWSIQSHFIKTTAQKKCKHCSTAYALSTGGENLKMHLQNKHIAQFNACMEAKAARVRFLTGEQSTSDTPPTSVRRFPIASLALSTPSTATTASQFSQSSIYNSVHDYQEKEFNESIAKFFSMSYTALRVVELEAFKDMMIKFRSKPSTKLPSRRSLKVHQEDLASKCRNMIVQETIKSDFPAALAIDGWTNCVQSKIINVLLLSQGNSYFLKTFENHLTSTSAEYLHEIMLPLINSFTAQKLRISGIVMDNASINIKLYNLLKVSYPHLVRLPCSAHLVQLCVRKILKLDEVQQIVKFMDLILNAFRIHSTHVQRLKLLQLGDIVTTTPAAACVEGRDYEEVVEEIEVVNSPQNEEKTLEEVDIYLNELVRTVATQKSNKPKVYALIRPTDTRWSSSLLAAKRILRLHGHIEYVARITKFEEIVSQIQNQQMWNKLSKLISILEPFKLATDILQADSSNLFTIYTCFYDLLQKISNYANAGNSGFDCAEIKRIILQYWRKHINIDATIMSAIFSLDETYRSVFTTAEIGKAKRWFIRFAVDYISKFQVQKKKQSATEISNKIVFQYGKFRGKVYPFEGMTRYVTGDDESDNCNIPSEEHQRSLCSSSSSVLSSSSSTSESEEKFDPKVIWGFYVDEARELSTCAIAILSLPSSEAAVERSFSKQGLIHRKLRNKTSIEQVETEMMINYNCSIPSKKEIDHSLVKVSSVIRIDDESNSSPVSLFQMDSDDTSNEDTQEDGMDEENNEMDNDVMDDSVESRNEDENDENVSEGSVYSSTETTDISAAKQAPLPPLRSKRTGQLAFTSSSEATSLLADSEAPLSLTPSSEELSASSATTKSATASSKRAKVIEQVRTSDPAKYATIRSNFIKSYVEQREKELEHPITTPIRWNETSMSHLNLALTVSKEYIKDTADDIQRYINDYIKALHPAHINTSTNDTESEVATSIIVDGDKEMIVFIDE